MPSGTAPLSFLKSQQFSFYGVGQQLILSQYDFHYSFRYLNFVYLQLQRELIT